MRCYKHIKKYYASVPFLVACHESLIGARPAFIERTSKSAFHLSAWAVAKGSRHVGQRYVERRDELFSNCWNLSMTD
jgi:hypothetical protein